MHSINRSWINLCGGTVDQLSMKYMGGEHATIRANVQNVVGIARNQTHLIHKMMCPLHVSYLIEAIDGKYESCMLEIECHVTMCVLRLYMLRTDGLLCENPLFVYFVSYLTKSIYVCKRNESLGGRFVTAEIEEKLAALGIVFVVLQSFREYESQSLLEHWDLDRRYMLQDNYISVNVHGQNGEPIVVDGYYVNLYGDYSRKLTGKRGSDAVVNSSGVENVLYANLTDGTFAVVGLTPNIASETFTFPYANQMVNVKFSESEESECKKYAMESMHVM